jgi:hypothetical protein
MKTKPRHYWTRVNSFTPHQLLLLRAEGWVEPRAVLYAVASRFKRNTTFGYSFTFNTKIVDRFQSKALRMIVDAPCYVPNTVNRRDLQA